MKQLIEAGANVNAANRYGVTPLALACVNGSAAVAGALLGADADPNAVTPQGETVLMRRSQAPAAGGADLKARSKSGWTALLFAAREGQTAAVERAARRRDGGIGARSTF